MKNIFFLIILTCAQFVSCKTANIRNENTEPKKIIEGSWLLKSISDNNTTTNRDLLLLEDVSLACFENSLWKFMPSTNSGQYNINDLYCAFGKRKFSILTQENDNSNELYEIILKFTEKRGDRRFNKEAKLSLIHLSDTNMELQYSSTQNNTTSTLKMSFDKVKTDVVTTD